MSQATEEKKTPRLYKRGNDDIDLDAYIRNAEAEFDYWLAGSRLKDKQKQEIRDVYSKMIQGISDGTINYKIGGGYNNSIGITNAPKGFDAAGLVAGFLGNILRAQDVYTAPPKEPDTSKTKYEGAKTIGSRGLSQLLGEAGNIQYFINQDEPINGKRGHSNRMRMLQEYINDIATEGNWDKYFTGYTQEQKDQWFKDYEKYGKNIDINGNGILDESEYLGLSKLLGLNNIEQLFYTGQTYNPETTSIPSTPTYASEQEYLDTVHPRQPQAPTFNRSLRKTVNYPKEAVSILANTLNSLSKEQLFKLIGRGLQYQGFITNNPNNPKEGRELTYIPQFIKAFNGAPEFNNNDIIKGAIELCRRKGYLKQFPSDPNSYYIPFESKKLDSKGTGLVYKISSTGDHQLVEMDRRDIPFFTDQWHNDFAVYVPSHKQGGILKFVGGGYLTYDKPYIDDDNLYNISLIDENQTFSKWPGSSNTAGVAAGINNRPNKYTGNIATGTFGSSDAIAALNNYHNKKGAISKDTYDALQSIADQYFKTNNKRADLKTLLDAYNANVSTIRSAQKDKSVASYGSEGYQKFNDTFRLMYGSYNDYAPGQFNTLGSSTYERLANAFENLDSFKDQRQFKLQGYDENVWMDNAGYLHIGEYGKPSSTSSLPGSAEAMAARKAVVASTENPKGGPEVFGADEGKDEENDEVDETNLPTVDESINTNSWKEYIPDLFGAGRLWASLHTNNKVYDTVLSSLKPVLKDTYESYSPVTGAFSTMQFANKQAADVMHQVSQPFTSDASLASARILEGQRQANQLQSQGFLADNQEIRRTQGEALARREGTKARWSEVANFNRASINQTDRERAQLDATRLKSNWQSYDNFLQGLESRLRTKFDENRTLSNNFREQISTNAATRWYNNVMEAADREKDAWIKSETEKTGKTPDVTRWPKWKKYDRRRREAENMMKAMQYRDMAKIYGISYTSPYTDAQYDNFIKWV